MINFAAEQVEMPAFDQATFRAWINAVAASYDKKVGQVSYLFCSDERMLAVNKQFLEHDYYTDIITFDYSEGSLLAGDIFISTDTVAANAAAFGVPYSTEVARIVIHGILHLCGQGDKTPETRAQMTDKENKALAMLSL